LTLTACSTAGGSGGGDLGRRVAVLEKDVGKMKVDVERLTKIEGDLNLVVGRLNEISGDSPAAPSTRDAKISAKPNAEPPQAREANGGPGIYLGSYKTEASAREAWRMLARKFEEPRGMSPVSVRVDLGKKGVFTRLIAGPVADARAACARLAAARIECAPAPFSGKPLE